MFQQILVPLDGSARAEQALSAASRLARACAGYLRHLFIKLGMCASIISFASHLALRREAPAKKIENK